MTSSEWITNTVTNIGFQPDDMGLKLLKRYYDMGYNPAEATHAFIRATRKGRIQ